MYWVIIDVFGKLVEITYRNNQWRAFYLGSEGKKRLATDISIPGGLAASEVPDYIADLCHEWATSANPSVVVLKQSRKAIGWKIVYVWAIIIPSST